MKSLGQGRPEGPVAGEMKGRRSFGGFRREMRNALANTPSLFFPYFPIMIKSRDMRDQECRHNSAPLMREAFHSNTPQCSLNLLDWITKSWLGRVGPLPISLPGVGNPQSRDSSPPNLMRSLPQHQPLLLWLIPPRVLCSGSDPAESSGSSNSPVWFRGICY